MEKQSKREIRRKKRMLRSGILNIRGIEHQEKRDHEFDLVLDTESKNLVVINVEQEELNSLQGNHSLNSEGNLSISEKIEKSQKRVRFETDTFSACSKGSEKNEKSMIIEKNLDFLMKNECILFF